MLDDCDSNGRCYSIFIILQYIKHRFGHAFSYPFWLDICHISWVNELVEIQGFSTILRGTEIHHLHNCFFPLYNCPIHCHHRVIVDSCDSFYRKIISQNFSDLQWDKSIFLVNEESNSEKTNEKLPLYLKNNNGILGCY